nr:MAG TPA: hypothetical protein [Caudoviricetes sp.]
MVLHLHGEVEKQKKGSDKTPHNVTYTLMTS